MTTKVNVFYHGPLLALEQNAGSNRLNFDALQSLEYPPLGRDNLTVEDSGATTTTGANASHGKIKCAVIQILTQGKRVYFEVSHPSGDLNTAGLTSPALEAFETVLSFSPGMRLSFREVAL